MEPDTEMDLDDASDDDKENVSLPSMNFNATSSNGRLEKRDDFQFVVREEAPPQVALISTPEIDLRSQKVTNRYKCREEAGRGTTIYVVDSGVDRVMLHINIGQATVILTPMIEHFSKRTYHTHRGGISTGTGRLQEHG